MLTSDCNIQLVRSGVDYFNHVPKYLSHGVNTDFFRPKGITNTLSEPKLLCVGHNGLLGTSEVFDRKGFQFAIESAKKLNLPSNTIRDIENNESKAFDKKIFLSLETELITFNIYEFFREIIGEKETTYEKIEYLKIVKECDFPKYKYYETIIKSKNSFYILIYEEETLEININVM